MGKLPPLSIKSRFQSLKLTFNALKKKLSSNVPIIFLKQGATVRLPLCTRPRFCSLNAFSRAAFFFASRFCYLLWTGVSVNYLTVPSILLVVNKQGFWQRNRISPNSVSFPCWFSKLLPSIWKRTQRNFVQPTFFNGKKNCWPSIICDWRTNTHEAAKFLYVKIFSPQSMIAPFLPTFPTLRGVRVSQQGASLQVSGHHLAAG